MELTTSRRDLLHASLAAAMPLSRAIASPVNCKLTKPGWQAV